MKILALLAALLATGGCRLHFWAGRHEIEIPPRAEPTPTAAPDRT